MRSRLQIVPALLGALLLAVAASRAGAQSTTLFFEGEGIETGVTVPDTCCFSLAGATFLGFQGVFAPGDPALTSSGEFVYRVAGTDLGRKQHAFIQQGPAGTAAGIIMAGVFGHVVNQIRQLFADQIELQFKIRIIFTIVTPTHETLNDGWFRGEDFRTEAAIVCRNVPPTEKNLTFLGHQIFKGLLYFTRNVLGTTFRANF